MSVIEVTSSDQLTQLSTHSVPLILYFHTPWAEPCVRMTQVYESLATTHGQKYTGETTSFAADKALFLSVNAEEHPDISESFDVTAVPFFVLLKDSTIVKELSGADPKELVAAVSSLFGTAPAASTSAPVEKQEEEEEETEEELSKRLAKLVKAAPVMLFMKGTPSQPQCGFSRQLVGILRDHSVQFGFFDILKDNSVREGLKKFSDWPTFPQLYINGELQGGLDIIKESVAEDAKFFENAIAA